MSKERNKRAIEKIINQRHQWKPLNEKVGTRETGFKLVSMEYSFQSFYGEVIRIEEDGILYDEWGDDFPNGATLLTTEEFIKTTKTNRNAAR